MSLEHLEGIRHGTASVVAVVLCQCSRGGFDGDDGTGVGHMSVREFKFFFSSLHSPRSPGSESDRRTALQLLAPLTRPPRPPHVPARRLPRRPGERREPILVRGVSHSLAGAAAARGLELGCAVELCLERSLVLRDLDAVRLASLYPRLLAVADAARVLRPSGTPAAFTRTRRAPTASRPRRPRPTGRGRRRCGGMGRSWTSPTA